MANLLDFSHCRLEHQRLLKSGFDEGEKVFPDLIDKGIHSTSESLATPIWSRARSDKRAFFEVEWSNCLHEMSLTASLRGPNKGNKAIEREIISSFQVAQSFGFKGDFRAWEHLLRIRE